MTTATQATPTQNLIPAGSWVVDEVHSAVGFEVKHMVVSTFRGDFKKFDAVLDNTNGTPRLVGTAQPASIDVRDENLAAHLASAEFFDADAHPEIRFESTALRVDADGSLVADGELTVKGHTRPVEAHGQLLHIAADVSGGERVGIALEAKVDRRAFGLDWNAQLPKGGYALGNDVTLKVALELVPRAS